MTTMKVAIAQIAPVLLDRAQTTTKVIQWIDRSAETGATLVVFGETLIPAYPLWTCRTDGARFDAPDQKDIHAKYLSEAVCIEEGHLEPICEQARTRKIAVVLGVAERPAGRGGHTIYCSRVFIDSSGTIRSVHRKLMPTYEERLSWGIGDGAGLVTHTIGPFTVGALNCWENWMPLARTALYDAGEDLHIALWPGCERLTRDITRFIALESRSFVISASAIIRQSDVPDDFPHRDLLLRASEQGKEVGGQTYYDGGSCIAAPDGSCIVEPVINREELITADLNHDMVLRERQNFDPTGHYARPDVLRLQIDRRRQASTEQLEIDTAFTPPESHPQDR